MVLCHPKDECKKSNSSSYKKNKDISFGFTFTLKSPANVITTNVFTTNVIRTNVIPTNVFTTNVITTNVITTNVFTTNVFTTNVIARALTFYSTRKPTGRKHVTCSVDTECNGKRKRRNLFVKARYLFICKL